ncbi:MAG: ECF transporter S component [Clostridiales bacterium]|nr:ECF transporter S component [Candidatus Equinaster intestinalis]
MKKINLRALCVTAIMGAVSLVLMLLEFPVSFIMPPFIKFDFSELPALITAFAFGPLYGAAVCLIKNLLHLFITSTAGVGELANFLLGVCFTVPAGIIYKYKKTRKGALVASVSGSAAMAVMSVLVNYFIIYPIYAEILLPKEAILGMYQAILPSVDNLFEALVIFNMPFNFVKGMVDAIICFLIYKKLSPILKKKR